MVIITEVRLNGVLGFISTLFSSSSSCCFASLVLFVCVEVLRPSQPNGVMSSAVSLPNHTLLGRLSPLSG